MARLLPLTNAMVQVLYRHRDELTHLTGYELVEALPREGVLEFEADTAHRAIVEIKVAKEITFDHQRQERDDR